MIVAIDGKATRTMDDLKRAVVSATTNLLTFVVVRQTVSELRHEQVWLLTPATEASGAWELYEVVLFSNRVLEFRQLQPPFAQGVIELHKALALGLARWSALKLCLQITVDAGHFLLHCESAKALFEWKREIEGHLCSQTRSLHHSWLALQPPADHATARPLCRWYFELTAEHRLCCFDTSTLHRM